ncbi:MAG TPA: dihydrodipicolinate synthase family protein [Thermoanaerobaculia bacterium]|jgi:dihydrodipicolinate synthase/N-acetylneuraminate lyase|nr:dihydrodipicolinate synthase family protein [Thermoanaerobaculia bacterium]
MKQGDWNGVFPAITTPFRDGLAVDFDFLGEHVAWLLDKGCAGIVALGSLGEAATLSFDEKLAVLETCRAAAKGRAPIVAGIAGLSTAECVALARGAEKSGCDGLMVLPAYVYRGDARETEAHAAAVLDATPLSCMLYNNPIAYGTDYLPGQIASLARRHPNLHAVKESAGDVRRVTAIRELAVDRLALFVGVDDLIVEGIAAGAVGWIAGLVNAFPAESVLLFDLALRGDHEEARRLYEWFLPLLRLDTVPKFVQLIKLVQQEVGRGSERVRPPRLPLAGEEREAAFEIIRAAIRSRAVL